METTMKEAPRREIGVVTAEIRTLTGQAQHMILNYAMEIGRRLVEAKSLLPHGEWGKWLKNEVEFSQSTANNFMKIFSEYSDNQLGFETKSNSQALGNLSYTKALALLAIPAEEREAFAEEVKADEMSSRELAEAIRAREEAEARAARADIERDKASAETEKAVKERDEAVKRLNDTADEMRREAEEAAAEEIDAMNEKIEQVNKALKQKQKERDAALAEAEEARAALEKAKAALKKAKENPTISGEKKAEISAEAVKKAEEAMKKKLEAAEKAAEEAKAAADKAKKEAEEALQKRSEAEKALAVADPDTVLFRELFTRVQKDIIEAKQILARIEGKDAEKAGKLREALGKVLKGLAEK